MGRHSCSTFGSFCIFLAKLASVLVWVCCFCGVLGKTVPCQKMLSAMIIPCGRSLGSSM